MVLGGAVPVFLVVNWLVVWNIFFIFHFIYGMSSFPLTNSYFSRLFFNPPTSFSYGFHMVFIWFSYGFHMVFIWFSYG